MRSTRSLPCERATDILKENLEAVGVDSCGFRHHSSVRSGGATAAANLNVPYRLFEVQDRWMSDSAQDGYVCEKVVSRLFVPMNVGIQTCHFQVEYCGHYCTYNSFTINSWLLYHIGVFYQ